MLTLFALVNSVSIEVQGWYYSILSFAAIYTLFDLGLSVVLTQIAAHRFAGLTWRPDGAIGGDTHRVQEFCEFMRWAIRRYLWLAVSFWGLLIPLGVAFFSLRQNAESPSWLAPWLLLVTSSGVSLILIPFFALVEGSGRVSEAYAVRLIQGIAGSLACWLVLFSGGALWAAAMPTTVGVVVALTWLLFKRPNTLLMFRIGVTSKHIGRELWPLQWRTGLTWLSGYFLTQIYTPVLFYFEGPRSAGQLGLSLTIVNMLGLVAQSWLARSQPSMGLAAAHKNWVELNRIFQHDFWRSVATYFFSAIVCIIFLMVFDGSHYADRLLSLSLFVMLLVVGFVGHVVGALAAHLRAHLHEPLMWIVVGGALFSIPCVVWSASAYGVGAMVTSMLFVQIFVLLPFAFFIWRRALKRLQVTI